MFRSCVCFEIMAINNTYTAGMIQLDMFTCEDLGTRGQKMFPVCFLEWISNYVVAAGNVGRASFSFQSAF